MNDLSSLFDDDKEREEVRACALSFFANSDVAGVNWLVSEIASKCCSSEKSEMRREICWMTETLIVERKFSMT
jgi:hypothetical protein